MRARRAARRGPSFRGWTGGVQGQAWQPLPCTRSGVPLHQAVLCSASARRASRSSGASLGPTSSALPARTRGPGQRGAQGDGGRLAHDCFIEASGNAQKHYFPPGGAKMLRSWKQARARRSGASSGCAAGASRARRPTPPMPALQQGRHWCPGFQCGERAARQEQGVSGRCATAHAQRRALPTPARPRYAARPCECHASRMPDGLLRGTPANAG